MDDPKTLVSTDWLISHLKDPDLRLLDASWYMPHEGRDAKAEYEAAHIPGARFFDIDDIADNRSDLPHMMPPVEKFMSRLRAMGVGTAIRWWSTTALVCVPPRGCGGCSASWGRPMLPCWMAACPNGRPRATRLRICRQ